MLISVILSSRGRIEKLQSSIHSLLSLATRPDQVEVLVRMDKDDPAVTEVVQSVPATIIVGDRHRGYWSMDIFWNELGRLAQGEWLFAWNDDVKMLTPQWDEMIRERHEPADLLIPYDNSTTYGWPAFPIIHRSVRDRLGHLTAFPGIDTWMNALPLTRAIIPMNLAHERPNNPAYAHLNDQTWIESQFAEDQLCVSWKEDWESVWEPLVRADATKLGA